MTIPTVTVSGSYEDAEGNPATGTVTFKLNTILVDSTDDTTVSRTPIVATLTAGAFTQVLAATSGGDITPTSGVVYTVTEQITGSRTRRFRVALPSSSPTVNIADLSPVDETGLVWEPALTADDAVLLTGAQTIAGTKTFSAVPLINAVREDIDLNDRYFNLADGADISDEWQAALANTTIRRMRFTKPGDYLIGTASAGTFSRSNLTVEGVPGARLVVDTGDCFLFKPEGTEGSPLTNIHVKGLAFYDPDPVGHVGAQEESHGIVPGWVEHMVIERCRFESLGDETIDLQRCNQVTVRDCYFYNPSAAGTGIASAINLNKSWDCNIVGNWIEQSTTGYGVLIEVGSIGTVVAPNRNRIVGNHFIGLGASAIRASATAADIEDLIIAHNVFNDCDDMAIDLQPGTGRAIKYALIDGNTVIGGGTAAAVAPSHRGAIDARTTVTNSRIVNNTIRSWGDSAGNHGIRATGAVISGNEIIDAADCGIYEEGTGGNTIVGNIVTGCGQRAGSGTRKGIRTAGSTTSLLRGNLLTGNFDNTTAEN